MNNEQKILDQKLNVGAKMGLITNAISIAWNIIVVIILIAGSSIISKTTSKVDSIGLTSSVQTALIVGVVIGVLIEIGLSIGIIIMCNNVLKGKATNGLVGGILALVLSGVYLITMIATSFNFVSGINLIFLGLNITSGVLLVMGKYLPQDSTEKV